MSILRWHTSIFILLCLYIGTRECSDSTGANESVPIDLEKYTTDLINNLLPNGYNTNLRPNYGGKSVKVNISILINDISAISETSMEYKLDFYMRHRWNDHRLAFPIRHNISRVTVGEELLRKIWVPDTFFTNGKQVDVHQTIGSVGTTLFRIASNGDILFSTKIALLAQCPMDLSFFPLDQQKCSLEMSSYGLLDGEMSYSWSEDSPPVEISPRINLPTFRLIGYNKAASVDLFSTGNYSSLRCDLFLDRSIGYYVSQVYVPAFLVVIISFIPFWLDRNDHHARVGLGVTTVLTMTTLNTNTNSDFPKISHLKFIDVYLFTCFVMVFLSLIQYAMVGYFEAQSSQTQKVKRRLVRKPSKLADSNSDDLRHETDDILLKARRQVKSTSQNKVFSTSEANDLMKREMEADDVDESSNDTFDTSTIDWWARWIFTCTFAAFNLLYIFAAWILVTVYSNRPEIQVKL